MREEYVTQLPPARRILAPSLIAAGGILALLSWSLHWAELAFPSTPTSSVTVAAGHAKIALYMGLLMLVRALLSWRVAGAGGRSWGGFAIVTGGILGGFAIFDLLTEKSRAVETLISNTASHLGLPPAQVRAVIQGQVAAGTVRVGFKPGIYVALLAAGLAIAGGIMTLRGRPSPQPIASRGLDESAIRPPTPGDGQSPPPGAGTP